MDERNIDVKAYPRILELLLLNFDLQKFGLFVEQCCSDDCDVRMRIKKSDSLADSANDSSLLHVNLIKSEVVKYMSFVHQAMPDAIFLLHYHQVQNKGSNGFTIFCKYTITGTAISDMFGTASPEVTDSRSEMEEWLQIKPRRNVRFAGNINVRNNDAVKRKYSTVGRYIDVSEFEKDFQTAQLFIQEREAPPKKKGKRNIDEQNNIFHCDSIDRSVISPNSTDSETSSIAEISPNTVTHSLSTSDESPLGVDLSLGASSDSMNDLFPQIDLLELFMCQNSDKTETEEPLRDSKVDSSHLFIPNAINVSLPQLLPSPREVNGVGILKLHVNHFKHIYKVDCSIQLC